MDKARKLYPLPVKIAAGEQPSAAKLTALSTQAKATADKLEFMVGDLWNAAGDQILSPTGSITANALHIPNLARALGKMAWLNPLLPGTLDADVKYHDDLTNYAGEIQAYLTYAPAFPDGSTVTLGGTTGAIVQGQFQTSPTTIAVTGDWSVTDDGRFYSFDPIPAGLVVTYNPSINPIVNSGSSNGPQAGWNVIPDPSSWGGAYDGLKISFANNTDATTGYHIWLPPRMSLGDSRHTNKSPALFAGPGNIQSAPDSGTLLMFQDQASDASMTNGNHYRYNLPDEITSGAANSKLPTGYLYLWDESFGTIIDNVAYFTPANTAHSKFKVRVTSTDLVNVFGATVGSIITSDSTQHPSDYKSRFKLIVVGTSLAKAVSSLMMYATNHTHKLSDGGSVMKHSDLDGLVTPPGDMTTTGKDATEAPAFRKSHWKNDDHPQYFHRWGSDGISEAQRDPWNNAIFGSFTLTNGPTMDSSIFFNQAFNYAEISGINAALMLEAYMTGTDSSHNPYIQVGAGPSFSGWIANGDNTNPDTILIRAGGSTGVAQMIGGQFQRLYFGNDNTYTRNSYYFDWQETSKYLNLVTGAAGGMNLNNLIANYLVEGQTVKADPPSGVTGGFQYSTPKTQYITIMAQDMNTDRSIYSGFTQGPHIIVNNNDSMGSLSFWCQVKFPHGASVSNALSIVCDSVGNGTTGTSMSLRYYPKPLTSGDIPGYSSTLMWSLTGNAANSWNHESAAYSVTHTVNNSATGDHYVFYVSLPIKTGGLTSAFGCVTIPYTITSVNN